MWFPPSPILAAANPASAFIALRWHEFFDPFSPDSFQPRICQLPTLVEELAGVANDTLEDARFKFHLQQIQSELKHRLAGDVEQTVCSGKQRQLIERAIKSDDPRLVRDCCRHLLHDGFQAYFEDRILAIGQGRIQDALRSEKPSKATAELWLGAWSTLALHRGYLGRDDSLGFDDALLAHTPADLLQRIREKLEPTRKPYECVIRLELAEEVKLLQEPHRTAVQDQLQAVLRKVVGELPRQDLVGTAHADFVLVHATIEETGRQSALAQFVVRLQPALNLFDLYRNGRTVREIRDGWVGSTLNELVNIPLRELSLQKLHPRKRAAELTVNALDEQSIAAVDAYLGNALELYHVAMTTEDARVRFLTLWSAMECLSHTVDGATTMERVSRLVSSVVAWRRLEKHLRYLAINLKFHRDNRPELKESPCVGLPNATGSKVFVEDVLETVTKADGDPRLNALGKHAGSHTLLLWRTYCLWDSFHSPENLRGAMRESHQRLDWQIGRIYRARNTLVHRGEESRLLPHLSNHLQYYFSTTISRLMHGISEKKDRTAREAAFRWCAHYDYVLDRLTLQPSELTVADILPRPERAHGTQPWAAAAGPV